MFGRIDKYEWCDSRVGGGKGAACVAPSSKLGAILRHYLDSTLLLLGLSLSYGKVASSPMLYTGNTGYRTLIRHEMSDKHDLPHQFVRGFAWGFSTGKQHSTCLTHTSPVPVTHIPINKAYGKFRHDVSCVCETTSSTIQYE